MERNLILKIILSLIFAISSSHGRTRVINTRSVIAVCPESHRFAISSGTFCCAQKGKWGDNNCPGGDYVECPEESQCEDLPPNCNNNLEYTGFGNDHDGFYTSNGFSDSKQVFINENNGDICIWWHRQYRHWWTGPCDNIGTNSGYAYISDDVRCPHDSDDWRRGGSDEYLSSVVQDLCHYSFDAEGNIIEGVCGASYDAPLSSSATAGVDVIVRNNVYIQNCQWKRQGGKWKCS